MKDKVGEKIMMMQFVGLRATSDSYILRDGGEDKKSKKHIKVCHKRKT